MTNMKKKFLTIMSAALLIVGLSSCGEEARPIEFEAYEIMDGGNYMIEIDIPKGNGEKEQNVTKGIREIIAQSKLGKEVGKPSDGTLQEVMEDYHNRYNKYAEENAAGPRIPICNLEVKCSFQNATCVTFLVNDGIYINGDPDYYKSIVRISDGRVMSQQELVNISIPETVKLIEKYAKDDTPVSEYSLEDGYWFSPFSGDSSLIMWAVSRAGWGETAIPLSAIEPYLTEEGKKLFSVKTPDKPGKKDEPISPDSDNFTIHGELGIFELQGFVKECRWNNGNEIFTYGFDEKGMWISENGKKPWELQQVVERDEQGRIIKMGDSYDEQYETFAYNGDGLITKRVMKDIDGYKIQTEYFYNDERECTKNVYTYDDPLEGPGEYYNTYTILNRDSQGNWTKRKNQNGKTETREIIYY